MLVVSSVVYSIAASINSAVRVCLAKPTRDFFLELSGFNLFLPAAHDLAAGRNQERVGSRAFPCWIQGFGQLVSVIRMENVVSAARHCNFTVNALSSSFGGSSSATNLRAPPVKSFTEIVSQSYSAFISPRPLNL